MTRLAAFSLCLLAIVSLSTAEHAVSLKGYNVDIHETSVSGVSSGAAMALQLQVGFSSIIKGAGIAAGGPYNCGAEHLVIFCMGMHSPISELGLPTARKWSGNKIDDLANMKKQRVYMIQGKLDPVVAHSVMDQLYQFYVTVGHLVDKENVVHDTHLLAGHTVPTDFDSPGNNPCVSTLPPFISNCGFDFAGHMLQHIYGDMKNRTMHPTGDFIKFKQTEFGHVHKHGMGDDGYLYVPKTCAAGAKCRLHIALHGCMQSDQQIGTKYIHNTGFDKWADNNNMIILFPQTRIDLSFHLTAHNGFANNFNACWDWVGFYDSNFGNKEGHQMKTIKNMIDKIASGHK